MSLLDDVAHALQPFGDLLTWALDEQSGACPGNNMKDDDTVDGASTDSQTPPTVVLVL